MGVPQKQGLDRSWNNARNAQTKNSKFLIYKFHRTQFQRSPTQQSSLVICHSNFNSNTNQNGKIRQVFLRTEVWTLLNFTVYPQPSLSLWQCFWSEVSALGSTGVLEGELLCVMAHVHCAIMDGFVTTPHHARNPLQGYPGTGPSAVALLSLLSDWNSLSQDRDVEFQPSVCDSQSTVHRGQQQGDKREVLFPGGQGKYDFTEDFQGH